MKKHTLSAGLLLALTLAFVAAPAFTPPFSGYRVDHLPVPIVLHAIQPAGYAFAIWGVIYLWLIVHAGFGLWWRTEDAGWQATRWPLIGSVALGTVWLAIATQWPLLATGVIVVMAALALWAYLAADQARDRWLLAAPLAIYAGWLTAASAVSVGVIVAGYGWMPHIPAAFVLLALVGFMAWQMARLRPAMPIYGLTIVWAIVGIVVANWGQNPGVAGAAVLAAGVIAGVTLLKRRQTAPPR